MMTRPERILMDKVRKAVDYANNGDPIKDAIDDHEIVEALVMLVELVHRMEGLEK